LEHDGQRYRNEKFSRQARAASYETIKLTMLPADRTRELPDQLNLVRSRPDATFSQIIRHEG
jgi:hypothetical protein